MYDEWVIVCVADGNGDLLWKSESVRVHDADPPVVPPDDGAYLIEPAENYWGRRT
jgi:hypothetical protein